ncbi:MAG TPA: hypothetical protein VKQ31_11205 [Steroidobacteraceae bacterium]|nr:hypothetical protein [Steroidobacteraceae bacterium]
MLSALLPIPECPQCRGGFSFEALSPPPFVAAELGIPRCRAHVFPVLDGIPVIQHGAIGMFEHTRGAYAAAEADRTQVRLRFEFPSRHYQSESLGMLACHPATVEVTRSQLGRLAQPGAAPELVPLIDSFVVRGAPRRYLPPLPAWLAA